MKYLVPIFFLLVGLFGGYVIGSYASLNWCVHMGTHLLEVKGVEIDVSEELITSALLTYKDRVNAYLGGYDAYSINDTRN